jgi:NAD(P)-dependent dehydrogenase (short-subunit alcohol dehydrogenase family)
VRLPVSHQAPRIHLLTLNSDSNPQVQVDDFFESFKVNTIGLINTVQAFLPLVRNGFVKKVVNLSSGMADINLINEAEIPVATPYAASKAAANVVIAKYNAALKHEGILFLSISPGFVATESNLKGEYPFLGTADPTASVT